ncbi:hypothetical protein [Pseudosporangium ferrugineum]|uniref:hypothetical protein n=1 Tax=Pseudosporangium ferrugineum TaxID=439699 RepID=UPI001304B508|nr:hypothetical protein [Pseudosporangium ferrugineum]
MELLVVAVASIGFDEVADASPFGRTGTALLAVASTVVACVGAVVGWRGASRALQVTTAAALCIAAGLIALTAMVLAINGGNTIIFAFLLAPAALFLALICRAVLQPGDEERGL